VSDTTHHRLQIDVEESAKGKPKVTIATISVRHGDDPWEPEAVRGLVIHIGMHLGGNGRLTAAAGNELAGGQLVTVRSGLDKGQLSRCLERAVQDPGPILFRADV
jgi:hypothetical protein